MAGYSENREQNMEMKYLRKVLQQVDQSIEIPEGIRAQVLRQKLDELPAAPRKEGWREVLRTLAGGGSKGFTLASGLSYAVAFALIVSLTVALRTNYSHNVIDGQFDIPNEARVEPVEMARVIVLTEPEVLPEAEPEIIQFAVQTAEYADEVMDVVMDATPIMARQSPVTGGGVGGGGEAVLLGQAGDYTLACRTNDRTDPDKKDYPITAELLDGDTVVGTMDISDLYSVTEYYVYEDYLALVGPGKSGQTARIYHIADPSTPVESLVHSQVGSYTGSRVQQGVLYLVTQRDKASGLEEEALPYSSSNASCIVTAIDMVRGEVAQRAFSGVNGEVSLYQYYISASYTGEGEAGEETFFAQIGLDGLQISLESVSE